MWRQLVWTLLAVFLGSACAQQADDILRDIQLGMQGLMSAGSDPELLAQLMQDMQDPELMAEAKKMMDDPEWQKQMKKLSQSKEFKDSVKKTQDVLKDPNAAAQAEAKMEHMLKVGQDQMKRGASDAMEEALSAMGDPAVMQEMAKMIKDPNFTKELQALANDPSFKNYVDAMNDMMKDPAKKRKFEALSQSVKANL